MKNRLKNITVQCNKLLDLFYVIIFPLYNSKRNGASLWFVTIRQRLRSPDNQSFETVLYCRVGEL